MRKRSGVLFLSSERDTPETISKQRHAVSKVSALEFFSDFPVAVFALNHARQIVFMNEKGRTLLACDGSDPYGQRPGEAFSCVNADKEDGGCGASHLCQFCGMAQSIASGLEGKTKSEESRFERHVEDRIEQLDLLVWAKPLPVDGERFILFAVIDISAEKRRDAFERIFLHDIMNTSGSLSSLIHLLDPEDSSFTEYLDLVRGAADQLTDEIVSHRVLRDAEEGILFTSRESFSLASAVSAIAKTYGRIAESRGIVFDEGAVPDAEMRSDQVLLKRVLANLLKNAIEACSRGERVSLSCSLAEGAAEFRIGNPAVMSESVMANLFKRSFSTKGRGRGLGTYAARLFVEEYLGGTIGCESEAGKGTVFTVRIPL